VCIHARGRSRGALPRGRVAAASSGRRGRSAAPQEHAVPWPAARATERIPAGAGVRLSARSSGRPATCRRRSSKARNQQNSRERYSDATPREAGLPASWWRRRGQRVRPPFLAEKREVWSCTVRGGGLSCHSPHLLYVLVPERAGKAPSCDVASSSAD
jgi:hypothetical protein